MSCTARRGLGIVWLMGLVASLVSSPVPAQDLRPFRTGLILAKQARHLEAAQSWQSVAERLATRARSSSDRRLAGIGFVLSAAAYEQGGDSRAYGQWGKAVEMFLVGQIRWADQREELAARRASIEEIFASVSPDTDAREIDDETMFFLELTEVTALTAFEGPRPGLVEQTVAPPVVEGEPEESRQYFARPLSAIQRERGNSPYTDPSADPALVASAQQRAPHPRAFGPETEREPEGEVEDEAPALQRRVLPSQEAAKVVTVVQDSSQSVRAAVRGQGAAGRQALSEEDLERARHAWRYIQENLQPNTGLVNSMNQYPRTTLWEIGSTLAAWITAEQLQLTPRVRFQASMERLLVTLERLPLYNDVLPNLEYDTETGSMVDSHGRVSERGSGWSALDIGRALIWLRILHDWYPSYREAVARVVSRWSLRELVGSDGLRRVVLEGGAERSEQQGRFGYEQYSAAGLGVWDVAVPAALDFGDVDQVELLGVWVPFDVRAYAYLTSEPFMLAALELGGISPDFARWTDAIYTVQRERYEAQDVLSAVSEDALAQPPWFVYNTIYHGGRAWQTVGPDGSEQAALSSFSVKAAFAWGALYDDSFADGLVERAAGLVHDRFGFLAGEFDHGEPNRALSLNTNAVVLEAILFALRGSQPFLELQLAETSRGAVRRP